MRRRAFLYLGFVGMLSGCNRAAAERIDSSPRAECYRVDPIELADDPGSHESRAEARVLGYRITARASDRGGSYLERLEESVGRLRSHGTYTAKACMFMPGVVFRIDGVPEPEELAVCFGCSEIDINGRRYDLGSERQVMLELAREAFPDDAQLGQLTP